MIHLISRSLNSLVKALPFNGWGQVYHWVSTRRCGQEGRIFQNHKGSRYWPQGQPQVILLYSPFWQSHGDTLISPSPVRLGFFRNLPSHLTSQDGGRKYNFSLLTEIWRFLFFEGWRDKPGSTLCSGITPGVLGRTYGVLKVEPRLVHSRPVPDLLYSHAGPEFAKFLFMIKPYENSVTV